MDRFKIPNFRLQKIFSDGSKQEPMLYTLKEIDGSWRMGRRGFLITTGIGIGVLSGYAQKGMLAHAEKAPVMDGKCADEVKAHRRFITAVSFSPDGKLLASGADDRTIKLWEMPSGKFVMRLKGHKHDVTAVSFSPDGKLLASGAHGKTIKLWEIPSGKLLKTLEGHKDDVRAVSFSPDGKFLASGSNDKTIRLWEMPSGKLVKTVKGHKHFVTAVSFSPDGRLLASGSHDHTIKLWEMPSGNFLTCLFDPGTLARGRKAIQYAFKNEYGQMITYTLPCGSPIPPGATCTCNCVPGTYSPPKPRGGTRQQYCSCVPVCTCVPIK